MSTLAEIEAALRVYGFAAFLFLVSLLVLAVPVAFWLRHRSYARYLRERDARLRAMLDDEGFTRADETDAEFISRIRANYRSRKERS